MKSTLRHLPSRCSIVNDRGGEFAGIGDPIVTSKKSNRTEEFIMKTISQLSMRTLVTAMTFAILGMGAGHAQAASVYFLQIDNIKGESTNKGHEEWIDIDSFSWGVSNSGTVGIGGGASSGKPVFSPFSWTQLVDKSVPPMLGGVASGKHYPNATLDVQQASAKPAGVFFQMKFDDVLLTKLDIVGAGDRPNVAGAFVYSKITMTYRPQKADGSLGAPVVGGWDLKGNKAAFFGSPDVLQGQILAGPTPNAVPVPAAVWLFGSGLLGLIGFARRSGRHNGR